MPAHWTRQGAATTLHTQCHVWSRDASRLVKRRWVRRETQALIAAVGEAVWGKRPRGKQRG